jgi:hypothetical protein
MFYCFGRGMEMPNCLDFSRKISSFLCQRTWQRRQKISFKFINVLHMNVCCAPWGQLISSWESVWASIAFKINCKLFSESLVHPFALLLNLFIFFDYWILLFLYFLWSWGLNSGPYTHPAGALSLKPWPQFLLHCSYPTWTMILPFVPPLIDGKTSMCHNAHVFPLRWGSCQPLFPAIGWDKVLLTFISPGLEPQSSQSSPPK